MIFIQEATEKANIWIYYTTLFYQLKIISWFLTYFLPNVFEWLFKNFPVQVLLWKFFTRFIVKLTRRLTDKRNIQFLDTHVFLNVSVKSLGQISKTSSENMWLTRVISLSLQELANSLIGDNRATGWWEGVFFSASSSLMGKWFPHVALIETFQSFWQNEMTTPLCIIIAATCDKHVSQICQGSY